jgi:hypothetical protein
MANEANKKRVITNAALMSKWRMIILGANALYVLFRMVYLWDSFSHWHMCGFALTSIIYLATYSLLHKAAAPVYAPLAQGGALISGGEDMRQEGVIEYSWDMLWTTMFIQLTSGFISDLFWLLFIGRHDVDCEPTWHPPHQPGPR